MYSRAGATPDLVGGLCKYVNSTPLNLIVGVQCCPDIYYVMLQDGVLTLPLMYVHSMPG